MALRAAKSDESRCSTARSRSRLGTRQRLFGRSRDRQGAVFSASGEDFQRSGASVAVPADKQLCIEQ